MLLASTMVKILTFFWSFDDCFAFRVQKVLSGFIAFEMRFIALQLFLAWDIVKGDHLN